MSDELGEGTLFMEQQPPFVGEYLQQAQDLLQGGAVGEPLFSKGTYQFEVQEKGKKKVFPFLQMNDEGQLTDSFCTCKVSETGHGCPHLAAAYLRIFNQTAEPLHQRYRKSFWNRLFQMACKRLGDETDCLKADKKGRYQCNSKTKKELFWIEAKTEAAQKRLEEIVAKRVVETEETSLKFSNLTTDELMQYRAGKAGPSLRYELSFWSDLAKWLLFLQEEGMSYQVAFEGAPLPHAVLVTFAEVALWFYIPDVSWPWLVPALATIESPLKVYDTEEESIQSIQYNEKERALQISHKGSLASFEKEKKGLSVGDWIYVENQGFYRKQIDSLLQQEVIASAQIATVLSESTKVLQRFLAIFPEKQKAQYRLFFDAHADLHIQMYLFEPGDLQQKGAAAFLPWVYLPGKGFYLIDEWMFENLETVIASSDVADFINRHRLWLHNFPGFQTHLGSLESHLIYRFTAEGDLVFEAELNFPEEYEQTHHFDEWVYIKSQGFYMKKESSGRLPLHPGLTIPKEEISTFIASHKDDLEQVQHFFSHEPLIQNTGLVIGLNEEKCITVTPRIEYAPGIDLQNLNQFGDFVYVPGKGFAEIPPSARLPERYQQPTTILPQQEAAFLAFELEPLKPYLLEVDPRVQKPQQLELRIRRIQKDRKKRGQEWLVDVAYFSEMGVIDLFAIWDAFQERKRHLFSSAGLLQLKEPRFNWIRHLHKRRLDRKRGLIRLNTLEWIRLNVFEEVKEPRGEDPDSVETRKLLQELSQLETHRLFDLSQLKATLRPYQELGLNWLWFLYCHGLSGLLCDDMGLGKTHQAMALLAAIIHEDVDHKNKYLVVCPTSVIYHWQEQLKRFLPEMRVCTYYGLARSLENFESQYDILLTSYGIMRTGREDLHSIHFEIAIYDEIQIAKNHASQTHQALKEIHARMRLGLTGTPIENKLRELKALFDLTLPGYMPSDPVFRDLFINPIEKQKDEEKMQLLHKLIKPFILRRKKSEVLTDLPEKIEEIAYCDLSEEQRSLYKEVSLQVRNTVYQELKDEQRPVSYLHVFSALSSLKQICDHPCLIHKDPKNFANRASGKWDLFVELLYEARDSGQKVVVFSQYLDMLTIIETYLKKKGIGYASIKGSTKDRSEQLRKFREDPECKVFVASLLAAGVGIDLTVASIVIHYDRWWNPAKENQATDRVHRIGQNRGVQVFKLVTKNTIEEHIHQLIERKKGLFDDIIGQEDQINFLNRDELLQVFEKIFKDADLETQ